MSDERTAILWVGDDPPTDVTVAIRNRGLLAERPASIDADALNKARATVFYASGASAGPIVAGLKNDAQHCLNHGHRVVVCCQDDAWKALSGISGSDHWEYVGPSPDCEVLAEIVRGGFTGAGPPATGPKPESGLKLIAEDEVLLRRAFWDCDIVRLKEQKEGRSAARVFRVHARRENQQPPGYLLPFLVKIDVKKEIEKEVANYNRFVDGHIPFTQRPNLNPQRTVSGPTRAVMVSDFVDEAQSLVEVCRRPEARGVLYSLFDDALRSWRRDAFVGSSSPPTLPITTYLEEAVKQKEIRPAVIREAKSFGCKAQPSDLLARLHAVSAHPYRIATIHGDLHPGNVMVRRQEAILIDFASVWESRPIIADLACLEVAACFTIAPEGTTKNAKEVIRLAFSKWKSELKALFACSCLQQVPPLQEPGPNDWLWNLCRQTRSMAAQAQASNAAYACALVIYLMRRARLSNLREHPAIGGYALWTAEQIVKGLEKKQI